MEQDGPSDEEEGDGAEERSCEAVSERSEVVIEEFHPLAAILMVCKRSLLEA